MRMIIDLMMHNLRLKIYDIVTNYTWIEYVKPYTIITVVCYSYAYNTSVYAHYLLSDE